MGTSLNGLTPAGTYPGLIKTGDNAPIDGTLKTLSDGNGNNLPMSVSTTTINLTGTAQVGGVAIANTTQLAAKQDTLVSGTNIKTINGTSVLGSGNIVTPSTNPSGVAGAIQFSNGSAFASDAANLFWDDTNNRLGIGTNTPTQTLDVRNTGTAAIFNVQNNAGGFSFGVDSAGGYGQAGTAGKGVAFYNNAGTSFLSISGSGGTGINILNPSAAFHIKGSGSTSATTSLLVQNSAGTQALRMRDDRVLEFSSLNNIIHPTNIRGGITDGMNILFNNGFTICDDSETRRINMPYVAGIRIPDTSNYPLTLGSDTKAVASAQLEMVSTTQGFLPPRMTTTQKNAISSPAAGLVVYDSTTNKLCCYNGSTWNDLF